jgi:hypothetical protein
MTSIPTTTVAKPLSPLEQKLKDAEARKAERLELYADQMRERDIARKLQELEWEEIEAAELDKAEAEHGVGRVSAYRTPGGPVIVSAPARITFRTFQKKRSLDDQNCNNLIAPNLLYPSRDAFDDIIEKWPALLVEITGCICNLAGQRAGELGNE